ncbi:MAG TPA: SufS family cysteine desulfurase [Candidatus Nanoarchaeia archaeon]|nr:SufS family cysteine desulfurase [Candidatus Nanoarchaeia archaeon]
MQAIEKDFPILKRQVNGRRLVYLDSAASSLTPEPVLAAMNQYYREYRSNIHRAVYRLSEIATQKYEAARARVAGLINSREDEVIFTRNTTESLNLLAYSLSGSLSPGDEIVLTEMEHHSNLIPWQQLAAKNKLKLSFIKVDKRGVLDLKHAESLINEKTKILSFTHASNILGTINPVKKLVNLARKFNTLVILDAAQSIPHIPVDVKRLDIDFMAFSGHKMFGPTGIGVLYGKHALLEKLQPFQFGGGMISEVSFNHTLFADPPLRFEAGTPAIAEVIGLSAAVDYINKLKMQHIRSHTQSLAAYAISRLSKVPGMEIYGPKSAKSRAGLVSFNIKGIHPHDLASMLDKAGVAIRAGHMCVMPLVKQILKQDAVCRASFHVYNTKKDIDVLVASLKTSSEILRR